MGKVLSTITKPAREFNIESRAHNAISKAKPTAAPKHKADELHYERLLKEQPEALRQVLQKNEALDKNLKNVFVTSQDPMVKHESQGATQPDRPLPLSRTYVESGEYGFHEPNRVPYGKTTLRKALRFISEHHADKKTYTAEKIAESYLMHEDTVRNILKYYKMYEIYIPNQRQVKATFAGPVVSNPPVRAPKVKLLNFKKDDDKDTFDK